MCQRGSSRVIGRFLVGTSLDVEWAAPCIRWSDPVTRSPKRTEVASFGLIIRRSPASRRPQRALRPGVLPQNGVGAEQWCAAALGRLGARERAEV